MGKRIAIGLAVIMAFFIIARYFWSHEEILVGDPAKNIAFEDLKGRTQNLQDFKDQYVILTFWGSWCVPCRASNKKLVQYYKEQDTARLKIISVGIEKETKEWKKAIKQDSLFWDEQFTPLDMFNNKVAISYDVHQTPTYFLINRNQVVIAKSGNIDQIIHKYDEVN